MTGILSDPSARDLPSQVEERRLLRNKISGKKYDFHVKASSPLVPRTAKLKHGVSVQVDKSRITLAKVWK